MKNKIIICVSGGVVQTAHSNINDVEIVLIDYDNLKEEGKTDKEMMEIYRKETNGLPYCIIN